MKRVVWIGLGISIGLSILVWGNIAKATNEPANENTQKNSVANTNPVNKTSPSDTTNTMDKKDPTGTKDATGTIDPTGKKDTTNSTNTNTNTNMTTTNNSNSGENVTNQNSASATKSTPATASPMPSTTAPTAGASTPQTTSPASSAMPAQKGDPKRGESLTQTCVACHNKDGNSTTPIWPKIAEQPEKYLIEQLKAFKLGSKGPRYNPSMLGMVQNLTEQDINDLSAFYAGQKTTPGVAQQNFVELGEKIYRGGNIETHVPACAACHGAKGEGNELAGFPRLSGQHAEYILEQLKNFKEGARSGDPNAIMRDIAKKMSDSEMQAVSSYVSGLH